MGKNGVTVDIGFKVDVASIYKDLQKPFGQLSHLVEGSGLSDAIKKEVSDANSELKSLFDDLEQKYNELSAGKIDASQFEAFKKTTQNRLSELSGQIKDLTQRFNEFQTALSAVNAGSAGAAISAISQKFTEFREQVLGANQLLSEFMSIAQKRNTGINFVDSTATDKAKKDAAELNNLIEDFRSNDVVGDKSINSIEELREALKKAYDDFKSLNKAQKDAFDSGDNNQILSSSKDILNHIEYIDNLIERYEELTGKDYDFKEMPGLYNVKNNETNAIKWADKYEKMVNTILSRINKKKTELESSVTEAVSSDKPTADVSEFTIKNGSISVPIKISTTAKGLSSEVNGILNAVQSSIDPIEVKFKLTSGYGKYKVDELKEAEELEQQINDLNIPNETKQNLLNLTSNIREAFGKELKINIRENSQDVANTIKNNIKNLQDELKQLPLTVFLEVDDDSQRKVVKDVAKFMGEDTKSDQLLKRLNALNSNIDKEKFREYALAFNDETGLASKLLKASTKDNPRITSAETDSLIKAMGGKANSFLHSRPGRGVAAFSFQDLKSAILSDFKDGITKQFVQAGQEIAKFDVGKFIASGIKTEDFLNKVKDSYKLEVEDYRKEHFDIFGYKNILGQAGNYQEKISQGINNAIDGLFGDYNISNTPEVKNLTSELVSFINTQLQYLESSDAVSDGTLITDTIDNAINSYIQKIVQAVGDPKSGDYSLSQDIGKEINGVLDDLISQNLNKQMLITGDTSEMLRQKAIKRALSSFTDDKTSDDIFKVLKRDDFIKQLYPPKAKQPKKQTTVSSGASESAGEVREEAEAMDEVGDSAEQAAKKKAEFAAANTKAADSARDTSPELNTEAEALDEVSSKASLENAQEKKKSVSLPTEKRLQSIIDMLDKIEMAFIEEAKIVDQAMDLNSSSIDKVIQSLGEFSDWFHLLMDEISQMSKNNTDMFAPFESILSKTEELRNLAEILKASKEQIKEASDAVSSGNEVNNEIIESDQSNVSQNALDIARNFEQATESINNFGQNAQKQLEQVDRFEGEIVDDAIAIQNAFQQGQDTFNRTGNWNQGFDDMMRGIKDRYQKTPWEYQNAKINVSPDFTQFKGATVSLYNDQLKQGTVIAYKYDDALKQIVETQIQITDSGKARGDELKNTIKMVASFTETIENIKSVNTGLDISDQVSQVQDLIFQFANGKASVEEVQGAISNLKAEISGIKSNLKGGGSSLNEVTNAVNIINSGMSDINKFQIDIDDLIDPPDEIIDKLNKLKDLLSQLQNADVSLNGINRDTSELIKEYLQLRKDISDDLVVQKKDNKRDTLAYTNKQKVSDISDQYKTNFADEYKQLDDAIEQINKRYVEGIDGIRTSTAEYKEEIKNAFKAFNEATKIGNGQKFENTFLNVDEAVTAAKQYLEQFSAIKRELQFSDTPTADGLYKFSAQVRDAEGVIKNLGFTYSSVTHQMAVDTRSLGTELTGFPALFEAVKSKTKELFVYWTARMFDPMDIIRYSKQIFNIIKEYDDALTEMRKVSDESVDTLKDFQKESFSTASGVGTTGKQLQQSTADWMRLGESLTEAKESAKQSNVLLNVSEFQNIDDATESLVSMSQAYQELGKGEIIDKLNNIGNNYSISTSQLAESLQKSSGTLKLAGNTIDEAIALTTAGNSILQDPLAVGTGLKMISLRLTGTKQAAEELASMGEDVDGMITTQSKLRQTILEATKVASNNFQGFDILDDNGNYKSTYQIMLGIADIYKEIEETDKQYGRNNKNLLLETVAGKNRSSVAAGIFSDPQLLKNVYESSLESQGSAQEELSKYLDSVSGKLQQTKNILEEIATVTINSEDLKMLLDLVNSILSAVAALAKQFGSLNLVLGAVGGIALKKVGKGSSGLLNYDSEKGFTGILASLFNKSTQGKTPQDIQGNADDVVEQIKNQADKTKEQISNSLSEESKTDLPETTFQAPTVVEPKLDHDSITEAVEETAEEVSEALDDAVETASGWILKQSRKKDRKAIRYKRRAAKQKVKEKIAQQQKNDNIDLEHQAEPTSVDTKYEQIAKQARDEAQNKLDGAMENPVEATTNVKLIPGDVDAQQITDSSKEAAEEAAQKGATEADVSFNGEGSNAPRRETLGYKAGGVKEAVGTTAEKFAEKAGKIVNPGADELKEQLTQQKAAAEEAAKANEQAAEAAQQKATEEAAATAATQEGTAAMQEQAAAQEQVAAGAEQTNAVLQDTPDPIQEAASDAEDLGNNLHDGANAAKELGNNASGISKAFSGLGNSIKNIAGQFVSIAANMLIATAASMAVSAVIKGLQYVANYNKNIIKQGKEAQTTIREINEAYAETESKTKSLGERYNQLRKGVVFSADGSEVANVKLSEDEYAEFLDVSNQLADLYPELVSGQDAQGNSLVSLSDNAETATDSLNKYLQAQKEIANYNIANEISKAVKGVARENEELDGQIAQMEQNAENVESISDIFSTEVTDAGENRQKLLVTVDERDKELRKKIMETGGFLPQEEPTVDPETGRAKWVYEYYGTPDEVEQALGEINAAQSTGNKKREEERDRYEAQATVSAKQRADNWKALSSDLANSIKTGGTYEELMGLSEDFEEAYAKMLNNVDYGRIFDNADVKAEEFRGYLRDMFVYSFDEALTLADQKGERDKMEGYITDLFTLDTSKMTRNEAYSTINDLLNQIFPDDKEMRKTIRVALGYTFIDETTNQEIRDNSLNNDIYNALKLRGYNSSINVADELTQEEAKILWGAINQGNFKTPEIDTSSMLDSSEEVADAWLTAIRAFLKGYQEVDKIQKTGTLGDILNNENFKENVEGYESNLSSLTSALQTLRDEGQLTADTMKDLQSHWSDMTDFSERGIQKYAIDELNKYINEFKDGWTDFSPEGIKQLDSYLQNLITTYKDVKVGADDARSAATKSIFSDISADFGDREDGLEVAEHIYDNTINALQSKYSDINWNIVLALSGEIGHISPEEFIQKYGEYEAHWTIYVTNQEQIEELANRLTDLQTAQSEIEDGITYRENRGLKKTVKQYDKLLDNSKEQIKTIRSQNQLLRAQQGQLRNNNGELDTTSDAYRNIQSQIDQNNATIRSLTESQREYMISAGTIAAQNIMDAVDQMKAAMSEGWLSGDTFTSLTKEFPQSMEALFHTDMGQFVNTREMNEFIQQQGDLAYAIADSQQALEKAKYDQNAKEIDRLSKSTGIAKGDIEAMNQEIANHPDVDDYQNLLDFTNENQNISDTIRNLQGLKEEILQAKSALGQYQLAQSSWNPSDNMQTIRSGMENAYKLWEQGWYGKDDYTSFAKLLATEAQIKNGTYADSDVFKTNYEASKRYLTEDASGVHNWFKDMVEQTKKLTDEEKEAYGAWAEFDEATGEGSINVKDMEKFAEAMGRSKEFAQDMLMAMNDAGYVVDLSVIGDDFANSFADIDYTANNAAQIVSNLIDEMDGLAKTGIDVSGGAEAAANALKQLSDSGFDVTDILAHLNEIGAKNGFKVNDDFSVDFVHPIEKSIDEAVEEVNNKEVKLSPKYEIEESEIENATQKLKDKFGDNLEKAIEDSGITKYKLSDLLAIDHHDNDLSAGEAELESFAETLGLTWDQCNALLAALVELGLVEVDPDVETEGVEEAKEEVEELKTEAEEPIIITTQHLAESSNQARTANHQAELQDRVQHIKQIVTTEVAQGSITPEEIKQMDDSEISMHFGVTGTEEIQQVKDLADQLSNQETDYTVKIDQTQINGILDAIKETHEAPVNVEMNTDAWDTFKAEVEAGLDVTITPNTPATPAAPLNQSQPAVQSSSTSTINVDGSNAVKQIGAFNTMMSDLSNGSATIDVDISGAEQNISQVKGDIEELQSAIDGIGNKDIGVNIDGQTAVTQLNALEEIITNIPDVQSTANIDGQAAVAQLNALEKQINDIPDGDTTVTANISDATSKLSAVRAMVVALNGMSATVYAKCHDTASAALRSVRDLINQLDGKNATSTITTYRKTVVQREGESSGTAHVSHYYGTAYANGTGYDMWTDYRHSKNAWAGGTPKDWELPRDEEALVNEFAPQHPESIVRDGKWMVIPGGPHIEQLKKGDIIFNAGQTEDLLRRGKTSTPGRIAHANGTAYNMINAYSGERETQASGKFNVYKNTSYKQSTDTKAVNNNTSAVKASTKETVKNTGKQKETTSKLDDFKKWLEKFVDWIEVRLDRLSNSIDNLSQKAENLIGFAKKNAEIDKALKLTGTGNEKYKLKTEQEKGEEVPRVTGITYEDIVSGTQIGDSLRGAEKYFQHAQAVYNKAIELGLVSENQANDIVKKVQAGAIDIKSYDKEEMREFISQYQEWYDKAMECVYAVDELEASQKELAQQELDNVLDEYSSLESISNAITGRAESMMKYYTSAGKAVNSKEAKKQLGNQVSEAQYMSGKYKQELDDYAKTLAHVLPYLKEGSVEYNEALAQYEELNQKYIDSVILINDLNKQIADLDITKLGYVIDRFKNAGEKIAALVSLKNTRGTIYGDKSSRITESDYSRQASLNNDVIKLLNDRMNKNIVEAAKYDIDSEQYKEYYDAIVADEQEIIKLIESNEELKKSIRELRWKPFNDLQDQINNTIEDLDHLRGLIKAEQLFDADDGTEITARGYANIALIAQQMVKTQKQIADYREALNKLQKEYKNGNISLETYNETSREYVKTIQSGVTQVEGYKDALVDMYKTQITNENKALQDVISKRKEALSAKKAYYDYDKKLRSENKDINNLKAQINALQGVTNDAGIAELARLRAELAEKETDHEETLRQHSFDMQQEGYQQLSDDANETLEQTLNAVESNAEKQEEVVNLMLENLKTNYRTAYGEIKEIIGETGTAISDDATNTINQISTAIKTVLSEAEINIGATFDTIANKIAQTINTAQIQVNNAATKKTEQNIKSTNAVTAINNAKNTATGKANTAAINANTKKVEATKSATQAVKDATPKVTAQPAKTTTQQKQQEKKEEEPALTGPVSGIKETLKKGSQGSKVKKLQKALNKLGYKDKNGKKLQVDGVMGVLTISSLKKFQKAMGITKSGKLDLATKKAFAQKGYRMGTLGTLEDELNFTHEGEIIRRSDGAILRQLPAGTQVIPRAQSENLMKWADISPDFLKQTLGSVQPINNVGVTNHYDSLITVNGNVDSNVMDRLEDLGKQLLNNRNFKNGTINLVTKEFQREWGKAGK